MATVECVVCGATPAIPTTYNTGSNSGPFTLPMCDRHVHEMAGCGIIAMFWIDPHPGGSRPRTLT